MTKMLTASASAYEKAVEILKNGGLAILPTETVYGVAAMATNEHAVSRVYEIKSRPRSKPLSAVVFSKQQAKELGEISPLANDLMDAFWPGPLTLVLPLKPGTKIHQSANAGQSTIGLRFPDIEWVQAFNELGFTEPLVLPSANTSGQPAPISAKEAADDIGDKVDFILDTGQCKKGVESTILSVTGNKAKLLRVGAIRPEDLAPYPIDWDKT